MIEYAKFILVSVLVFHARISSAELGEECKTRDGKVGKCDYLKKWDGLNDMLKNSVSLSVDWMLAIAIVRTEHCGFVREQPLVCCDKSDDRENENILFPKIDEGSSLLPQDCGRVMDNKFFGGNLTQFDDYPWLALLEYNNLAGEETIGCGGSLISNRYILTAAHCLSNPKMQLKSVRLGKYDISSDLDCMLDDEIGLSICIKESINVDVEEQIVHPEFESHKDNPEHDVALIRLAKSTKFTPYIKPICLPAKEDPYAKHYVSGWGKSFDSQVSNLKLHARVSNADRETCTGQYKRLGVEVSADQVCVGLPKEKPFIGDSGGPLMQTEVKPDDSRRFTVYGVQSRLENGCPGLYTNVYDHLTWIHKQILP